MTTPNDWREKLAEHRKKVEEEDRRIGLWGRMAAIDKALVLTAVFLISLTGFLYGWADLPQTLWLSLVHGFTSLAQMISGA